MRYKAAGMRVSNPALIVNLAPPFFAGLLADVVLAFLDPGVFGAIIAGTVAFQYHCESPKQDPTGFGFNGNPDADLMDPITLMAMDEVNVSISCSREMKPG